MTVCEIENVADTELLCQGEKGETGNNYDRFRMFSNPKQRKISPHWPTLINTDVRCCVPARLHNNEKAKLQLPFIIRSVYRQHGKISRKKKSIKSAKLHANRLLPHSSVIYNLVCRTHTVTYSRAYSFTGSWLDHTVSPCEDWFGNYQLSCTVDSLALTTGFGFAVCVHCGPKQPMDE